MPKKDKCITGFQKFHVKKLKKKIIKSLSNIKDND